jgi:hypothetical protein
MIHTVPCIPNLVLHLTGNNAAEYSEQVTSQVG